MIATEDLASLHDHFSSDFEKSKNNTTEEVTELDCNENNQVSYRSSLSTIKEVATSTKIGWRFLAAFGCLCLVNLVCAIDATIIAVALPTIATKLNGTAIEAFWTGTSFLLTSTVFQPTWASLSHIFGRRPILLVALSFFTLGSIITSVATNFTVVLVGRCIQGIGGGGLVALTYVIVTDMVSLRDRGKWFGLISLQWAMGTIAGPLLGGVFSEKTTWRWIFWLNIPFCVVAFIAIPIFLKFQQKIGSVMEKLKRVDWIGSFLFVSSTTSFLIPLTWGGVMYPWGHWRTYVPLVLGVLGMLGFVAYSKFVSTEPLIRSSIFRTPTSKTAYFGTVCHGMVVWSALYYMPLYFQVAKQDGPIQSGVAVLPLTLTSAPAAVITGLVITKTGSYRPCVWLGWILTTLGCGLLTYLKVETSTPVWVVICIFTGIGTGILFSAQSFAVQASASNADLAFAAAMYSFFRSFGQTLGVAIGGTIFQNVFKHKLLNIPALASKATELARDASSLVQVLQRLPASEDALKKEMVEAYTDSLRFVWVAMCALAGVAMILSFAFTKVISLERQLETEQGFVYGRKVEDEER